MTAKAHVYISVTTCVLRQKLTSSGDLSYLGAQWRRDVAFAGYGIPLQVMPTSTACSLGASQHLCCFVCILDFRCSPTHVPQGDLAAGDMIRGVENVDPARRQKLMDLLDINPKWRLNTVSDGQRRRVQICMGLLKPYQASVQSLKYALILVMQATSSQYRCIP